MKIELWPIDRPKPYSRNARKISELAIEKVARSIKDFGWRQPIVVDGEGVIIAGHTRLLAAGKLGATEVPVCVAADLSPEQVKAYRLADNRSHEEAEWDLDMLGAELFDLKGLGFDLGATAFDEDELAELFSKGKVEDEDAIPDAPANPVTVTGDVYRMGVHRLMCGDSTSRSDIDRLLDGKRAHLIFADPPYGISVQMNNPGTVCAGKVVGDETTEVAAKGYAVAAEMKVPMIFWGANHYAADAQLPNASCWIVWDKQDGKHVDHADCELAWTNIKGPARVFKHIWDGFRRDSERGEKRVHPTQKPVKLAAEILDFFRAGKVIVDMFGGSGATLIACENTDRICMAMELEPALCDVIVTRWEAATGKRAVLQETGQTFEQLREQRLGVVA